MAESKYPTNPCRNEFRRLVEEDPALLISWAESGELEPADLTFVAEYLGEVPSALGTLIELSKHPSSIVREGALYGLLHLQRTVESLVDDMAEFDESPALRSVARGNTQW